MLTIDTKCFNGEAFNTIVISTFASSVQCTPITLGKSNKLPYYSDKRLVEDNKVWETVRKTLESDRDSLNKRVEGLLQQNTLLHTQLETLSKSMVLNISAMFLLMYVLLTELLYLDVVELQKAVVDEASNIKESSGGSGDKTTEELWEIIRYSDKMLYHTVCVFAILYFIYILKSRIQIHIKIKI